MNTVPTTPALNTNWFAIHYSGEAPAGLPPVIQAARVLRYSDDTGTWLVALWETAHQADEAVSACILRVPAEQVMTVTRHGDMGSAARQFLLEATEPAAPEGGDSHSESAQTTASHSG